MNALSPGLVLPVTLDSLATLPRWVAWQTEPRGPKNRPTKVPYAPDGGKAMANNPATWGLRDAAAACAALLPKPFGTGGVGLELGVIEDGRTLAGVDLDSCRDPAGVIESWAIEVIDRFATYTEVSPSGTGVKAFLLIDAATLAAMRPLLAAGGGKAFKQPGSDHPPGIEIYTRGRYFAVTGDRLDAAPAELAVVPADDLQWLLTVAGPALAGGGAAVATVTPGSVAPMPMGGTGDGSRSGVAFGLACKTKRQGGDFAAFLIALDADADAAAWKAEKGEPNGGRELRRAWETAGRAVEQEVLLTEHGVARAFTERHRDALRYCHDAGSWFVWSGSHWRQDRKHAAFSFARELAAEANRDADPRMKATTGKAAFAGGVERFAQRDPAHAVTAEDWDRDPFLLATPGGVVELNTGTLRPAQPGDMMTKIAAVAPGNDGCPMWLRFLDETTGNDAGMIRFLQQWCGYCLTGDTREHALLFGYGPGGNGKSVFLNTVAGIMGDYATVAAMDTFTASSGDKHSTDLAMLRGARLVTATETEEGRAWAESRIKQLTGGDAISARFMRQDFFTFRPQFKLTIVGNHKPILKTVDDAARRRFNLAPFVHTPATPDRELEHKLRAEWPGILAWMVAGCLDWQAGGLTRPDAIKEATADYFEAQDHFARWLGECCQLDPTLSTPPAQLLGSFQRWCAENGEPSADNQRLRGKLEATPGVKYAKRRGTRAVDGIGLVSPFPPVGED